MRAVMAAISTQPRRSSMRQSAALLLAAMLAAPGVASAAGDGTEQLVKYYRKKQNVAPGMKITVTGLKESSIECAKEQKPDAFWKLYTFWFENQGQVTADNVKDKATEVLKDTGIDLAKWGDCFDNQKTAAKIDAQMQEGSSVGVRGTPGFIINGRLVSGAQPFESFKNIIDDELASAK